MFQTNDPILEEELLRLLHFFKNELKIDEFDKDIRHECVQNNDIVTNNIYIDNNLVHSRTDKLNTKNDILRKRYYKRFAKLSLYEALCNTYHIQLAWGSLTGIRPTKLFYELMDEYDQNPYQAKYHMIHDFYVPEEKADICLKIIQQQKHIVEHNDKLIDLYIHIPFCISKCYYCSFISAPLSACQMYVEPYIEKLVQELEATKKIIQEGNYIVKSIYIGGGTPTSLSAEQLETILSHIGYAVKEFTVECGRPDTITKEKLDVLQKYNVTRISINPQTFSNRTLKMIGRNHSSEDVIQAYRLALNYSFAINMDLIAGLDKESFATFKKSLNKTLELQPDNVTVHTLSVKRTSALQQSGAETTDCAIVSKMVDYAYQSLLKAGYSPYYLYRQKNMIGNLENIGYSLPSKQCIFNIDSMEEVCSVIAVGANAISKRVFTFNNRIVRYANVKNLADYLSKVDEIIEKKRELFLK